MTSSTATTINSTLASTTTSNGNIIASGNVSIGGGGGAYNVSGAYNQPYYTYPVGAYTAMNTGSSPYHIASTCKGNAFSLSGPIWVREDITLNNGIMLEHFARWAVITGIEDYGSITILNITTDITIHPAFCSKETYDAFGIWWEAYTKRFESLSCPFPTMPCGAIGSVSIIKATSTEEEFRAIYPLLNGNIWLETDRWVFSDQRDAVLAKMLFSKV